MGQKNPPSKRTSDRQTSTPGTPSNASPKNNGYSRSAQEKQTIGDDRINSLLQAAADCASALLSDKDFDRDINEALEILGTSIDADRLVVLEHHNNQTDRIGHVVVRYEWNSTYAISQLTHPELSRIDCQFAEDRYRLLSGNHVGGFIETYPEPFRSRQQESGVKATYGIPIMVRRQYWGILGLDFCRTARELCEAEIAVLKTAATFIGSAFQGKRNRQLKKKAEHDRVLSKRDRILSATAEAYNILFTGDNFDRAVNKALSTVGQTMDVDRVLVIEHWHNPLKPSLPHWKILYEWRSAYVKSQLFDSELSQGSYAGIEEWYEILSKGQSISRRLAEIPEPFRSIKAKIGIKVLNVVPIFIEGEYWGVIAINACREETHCSKAELSILKTAAACIGGAIQQERIRRAKEEADRNVLLEREKAAIEKTAQLAQSNQVLSLRDRWLEATANAANKLLQIADLDAGINAALKVLGESLDCDRVAVRQHYEDNIKEIGFVRFIYEWNSTHVDRQMLQPERIEFSWDEIEEWLVRQKAGEWVGGVVEELAEPFRSGHGHKELKVKSLYNVPIFVNNKYWGTLGIDYCREAKRLTLPEIAVFKTAASCVGSAIYRQQIQRAKEEAELAILNERNRMAREIHDTLAQAFTGISLQLEAAKNTLTTQPEAAQERLLRAKNLAQEGINEARRSVRALRPQALESGNLITALRQLIDKMVSGAEIDAEILVEGKPIALNSEIEVELFRIAQEALTNTLRHAQASEICIQLIYETDTIHLQIEDNGIGFDVRSQANVGFGLLGIRERCDRLNCNLIIDSTIAEGTIVTVSVSDLGSWEAGKQRCRSDY